MASMPDYPEDVSHEHCLICWDAGWHARDGEIAQLTADRDRLYRHAYDRPGSLQRRLDDAFIDIERNFFAGVGSDDDAPV